MQGCRIGGWLAGIAFTLLAAGCQSSTGGSLATGSGPSRDFGLRAPPQSEPRVDDALAARKSARRSDATEADDDLNSGSANRRSSRWTGKDQPPAERKPLPVADSADSSADDELEM